jgi:hypothetical protein
MRRVSSDGRALYQVRAARGAIPAYSIVVGGPMRTPEQRQKNAIKAFNKLLKDKNIKTIKKETRRAAKKKLEGMK